MSPVFASAARSGYENPILMVSAVTPVAEAVSWPLVVPVTLPDPGVVLFDLLLAVEQAAARIANTASAATDRHVDRTDIRPPGLVTSTAEMLSITLRLGQRSKSARFAHFQRVAPLRCIAL